MTLYWLDLACDLEGNMQLGYWERLFLRGILHGDNTHPECCQCAGIDLFPFSPL